MKSSLKTALLTAALSVLALITAATFAQEATRGAPINAEVEQYKVVDTTRMQLVGGSPAATLEATLNAFGAQGWKVRAAAGNLIILAH